MSLVPVDFTLYRFLLCITILAFMGGCKLQPQRATQKLHGAVLDGKTKAAQRYLVRGASPNYKSGDRGWTPLLFAAEAGYIKVTEVLINHGADADVVSTQDEVSPLQRASARGYLPIVRLLVESGADIDHQDSQFRSTALMWACINGHYEVAQYLLDQEALINVRGNRGESALFLAVSAQHMEIVRLLLSYNAIKDRPDIYGKTPLEKAKELGDQQIVDLLTQ